MQYLRSTLLIGVILFILVSFVSCDEKKSSKDKHLNKHASDKEHETLKKPVKDKAEKSEDKHLEKHTSEHETSNKPIHDEEKGEDKHLEKHASEHETSKKPIKDEKKSEDKHLDKHTSEHETSKKPTKDEKKGEDKHASEHETSKKLIKDEKKSEDKHASDKEHETSKKPVKDKKKGEDKHVSKHTSEKEHETSTKPVKDKKKGEDNHLNKHSSDKEHEASKKPIKDKKTDEDKHLDKHASEHETPKKPIKDEKKSEDKHLDKHTSEDETSKEANKDEKNDEDRALKKHASDHETSKKPIKDEKKSEDKHLDKHTSEDGTSKKANKDKKKDEDKALKKHASDQETSKKPIKEKKSEAKPLIKYVSQHKTSKKKNKMNLKNRVKVMSLEKNAIKHEIVSKKEIENSKKALKVEVTFKKEKSEKKSPIPDEFSHSFKDGGGESGSGEDTVNKCNKPIDLVVALDSSESIREANWTKLVRFTKDLVKSLDPSLTRIGIIRYNTKAEVPVPLGFFQSFEAFSTTLDGVFYEPGGTRTDVALSKALAVFASGGQRRASKILIVVTDNPTNDIRISKDNLVIGRDLVEKPAENLKTYEVITFGVGIKYSLTEEEKGDLNQELKMITQDEEGDKRIVEVENYEELLTSANKVAGKICLVNGGWSSWTPWSQCTASCGGGTKVRLRRCDNPIPRNNGTNCTELGGSSVETRTCNIYPCNDGIELTSISQRPLRIPLHPLAQSILFSKDCPNGFDFVYVDRNQMSASSVYSRNTGDQTIMKFHAPGNGILYNVMNAGAWCAEHSESVSNCRDQYLQTDLKIPVKIAKIGTQGEASVFGNNWVTFYKFNYSVDGRTWNQYKTILTGNTDRNTVKENVISPPVIARYVRFNPVHWNVPGGRRVHDICLRVGVFTCTEVKNIKHAHKKVKRALIRPRKYRLPY